jgi:hypothetical protein
VLRIRPIETNVDVRAIASGKVFQRAKEFGWYSPGAGKKVVGSGGFLEPERSSRSAESEPGFFAFSRHVENPSGKLD